MQKTQFAPKNFFFVKHAQLAVSVGAQDVGAEIHGGLLLLKTDTEADCVATVNGSVAAVTCRSQDRPFAVPGTTPQESSRTSFRTIWVSYRNAWVFFTPIGTPLLYIPVHIKKAPRVWLIRAYLCSSLQSTHFIICKLRCYIITPRILCRRSCTTSILPLCIRRESELPTLRRSFLLC